MTLRILILIILSLLGQASYAQRKISSKDSAKDTTANKQRSVNTISLYQQYYLVREANKGNPIAEHELGLRYLNGFSFPKDLKQAVYWIKRSADQYVPAANFNLGLLYYRGEGVEWDPFKAYKYIEIAAKAGLSDALYFMGILYLDNFVVPSDFNKAYSYIKASADSGYKPAMNMIKELGDDGIKKLKTMYGDEEVEHEYTKDEIFDIYWKILLNEISKQISIVKSNDPKEDLEKIIKDTSAVNVINRLAMVGNSEALLILGMFHEKGVLKKDIPQALEYYFRAIRLDSKWGYFFMKSLYDNQKEYQAIIEDIRTGVKKNDPVAMYDYYCLSGLGFDNSIDKTDAFGLLKKAVARKHIPSMIELALGYAEGKFEKKNVDKAISVLKTAEQQGAKDAELWIARLNIQENFKYQTKDETIAYLLKASDDGILYAQVMLGYCYEKGLGVDQDDTKAVEMYRTALSRGNKGAFAALKRMHDKIRPGEQSFLIENN